MTALLVAAGIASGVTGAVPQPQYMVKVAIYHGDPLGSQADGTLDVLSRPTLLLTGGQTGYFGVGQTQPVARNLTLRMTPGKIIADKLWARIEFDWSSESVPPNGSISTNTSVRLTLGRPLTVRLAADSPSVQTWIVLTAVRYENRNQLPAN